MLRKTQTLSFLASLILVLSPACGDDSPPEEQLAADADEDASGDATADTTDDGDEDEHLSWSNVVIPESDDSAASAKATPATSSSKETAPKGKEKAKEKAKEKQKGEREEKGEKGETGESRRRMTKMAMD